MILKSEIKDFVKKVLILWILLSLLINLFVTYFSGLNWSTFADSNDTKFKRADIEYLWTTWVAASLNIGTRYKESKEVPVNLFTDVMSISYILSNKAVARDKIITSNMINLNEYLNILKTDVNKLLAWATDREMMLTSFLDQLQLRYKNSNEELNVLKQQWTQLQGVINSSNSLIWTYKNDLTAAYKTMNYNKTKETLDNYLLEKDKNTYASTYLIFIWKFIDSYTILNNYNKALLDTLINNKQALVKNATVVLPDSWNALLKNLNLVKTEAEWKAQNLNDQ